MTDSMIRTKEIRKSFGTLEVLKGIDLLVERGEVVSIVGPSGAGKTTLLQILGTLSRPSSGEIEIDGDILWTGIKVLDFFAPMRKGFKMGLLGGAGGDRHL